MTRHPTDDPHTPLDDALATLPREVPPARDLWGRIEARLDGAAAAADPAGRARARWGWQLAAALALVAVSSLVTATLMRRDVAPTVARLPVDAASRVRVMPASFGPGHPLSPEYEQARHQLDTLLQERIDRMPPAARRKLEENLAQLRSAAGEINDALARQPGDPLLEELLLSTYQEELAVLAAANQLTAAGGAGPRTDSSRMQL